MTVAHDVREWRPVPALARHVTCVWTQTVSSLSAAFTHRKAPHGSVELVCAVGSIPRIFGPQTGPVEETLAPGTTIVGVRLRPEAASTVLGMPTSELVDLALDVDELWSDQGKALQELVAGAGSAEEAARTFSERWASDSPRPPTPWSPRASGG
jgi:hypothetical protein